MQPATASAMYARLSASRLDQPLAAFCGGPHPHTLLSCCASALLPLLSTRAALPLRAACREARGAIAAHPWADTATPILGSVAAWRACFPAARAASAEARRSAPLQPADVPCFAGLQELRLHSASREVLAAARALPGLRVVQERVLDKAALYAGAALVYRLGTQRSPENFSGSLYFALELWLKELAVALVAEEGEAGAAAFAASARLLYKVFAYCDRFFPEHHNLPLLLEVVNAAWREALAGTLEVAPGAAAACAADAPAGFAAHWAALGMEAVCCWRAQGKPRAAGGLSMPLASLSCT